MNELYRYITLAVTPEWRRLPEDERAAQKRELADAVARAGARMHAYSLVGTRNDADLLLCHGYKANLVGRPAARKAGIPGWAVARGWTGQDFRVRCYDRLDRHAPRLRRDWPAQGA